MDETLTPSLDGPGSQHRAALVVDLLRTFDQAPVALVGTTGPEHTMVAGNAAYRALLGHVDMIGRPVVEAFPEAVGQRIFDIMDRIFQTGEPVVANGWRYQLDLDGSGVLVDLYLDFSGSPMRDDGGEIVGTLFSVGDATERVMRDQQADQETLEARQQYAEALDEITRLQSALLPGELPIVPGLDVAASYLLAASNTSAGGDWFDSVIRPDGRVVAVVGDVVGHGVAASAVMGQLRAVLHERLLSGASLVASLEALDRFADSTPAAHAATVCVVEIDPRSGAVSYCTAGHLPPLVVSTSNGGRYLDVTGGGPLGTGAAFEVTDIVLEVDVVMLLYTDGILERPGIPTARASAELSQVATDAAGNRGLTRGASTRASERVCQSTLEHLTRESGHSDDITLLAVQRVPMPVTLEQELDSPADLGKSQHELNAWLRAFDVTDRDYQAIRIAVSELIANSFEHGYDNATTGSVRLRAALEGDGVLRVEVADRGTWQEPVLPPDTSGRGLWITGQLVDQLHVERTDGRSGTEQPGTTVTFGRRLMRPAFLATGSSPASERHEPAPFAARIGQGPPRSLQVDGPVDFTTAAAFADKLDVASRGGVYPLIVDLDGVDLLASAGVSALFTARERCAAHHRELVLVAAPGTPAHQVLDLVGLDHLSTWPET